MSRSVRKGKYWHSHFAKGARCPNCGQEFGDDEDGGEQDTGYAEYFQFLHEFVQRKQLGRAQAVPEPGEDGGLPEKISADALCQGYLERFFRKLGVLGRGSRAAVYLVEHVLDGVPVGQFALKEVPVGDSHDWLQHALDEVKLLCRLSHPNLVHYNHVWLEMSWPSSFGPAVPCAYILQDYCDGGTLEDHIAELIERSDDNRVPSELIQKYMLDILEGVAHLHEQNIVHRDLKTSNCLLQNRGGGSGGGGPTVLVSDFGECQLEGTSRQGTGTTGTLEFCAPELVYAVSGNFVTFSRQTDMFAIGMILHHLCFGELPYSDAWQARGDLEALKSEVSSYHFDFGRSNAKLQRDDLGVLVELMTRLLGPADGRPTASQALKMLREARGVRRAPGSGSGSVRDDTPYAGWRQRARALAQNSNALRLAKLASVYVVRPRNAVLNVMALCAALELVVGHGAAFFGVHCVLAAAALVDKWL